MNQDSMTQPTQEIKRVTLRWPEDFWEKVTIEATKRRSSVQAIATVAVAGFLGIDPPTVAEDASKDAA